MIEHAGGIDLLGFAGEKSRVAEWADVETLKPQVVVVMPCGYDADRAATEALPARRPDRARWTRARGRRGRRPRTSRAPARGSWTGSSCSRTCCTPTASARRRAGRMVELDATTLVG